MCPIRVPQRSRIVRTLRQPPETVNQGSFCCSPIVAQTTLHSRVSVSVSVSGMCLSYVACIVQLVRLRRQSNAAAAAAVALGQAANAQF